MLNPVPIHPGPQCLRTNAELPCDICNCTRTLNDHFDGLILKLRRKTLPPLRHVIPPFPERNPIGSHVRNLRGSPQSAVSPGTYWSAWSSSATVWGPRSCSV